jgi:hypothetical protein
MFQRKRLSGVPSSSVASGWFPHIGAAAAAAAIYKIKFRVTHQHAALLELEGRAVAVEVVIVGAHAEKAVVDVGTHDFRHFFHLEQIAEEWSAIYGISMLGTRPKS